MTIVMIRKVCVCGNMFVTARKVTEDWINLQDDISIENDITFINQVHNCKECCN